MEAYVTLTCFGSRLHEPDSLQWSQNTESFALERLRTVVVLKMLICIERERQALTCSHLYSYLYICLFA